MEKASSPPNQLPYPLATVLSHSTALSFLSSRAYPDFLLHSSHRCHLCGSPQREPHAVVRSHNRRQEIRGSRGICGAPFGCPKFTVLQPLSLSHPERSASQNYRKQRALWRGVEEPVPSVAEGTPAMLVGRCSWELSGRKLWTLPWISFSTERSEWRDLADPVPFVLTLRQLARNRRAHRLQLRCTVRDGLCL
jgi:hypothetical protein